MPTAEDDPELARQELIRLLADDEYVFPDGARLKALEHFPRQPATECRLIDYILARLREKTQLNHTLLGQPPGSLGVGWTMNPKDGSGLYIKLKIDGRRVIILSCHRSIHERGES